MVLGAVAALSFAAMIALTLLSRQLGNGVIAAGIGVPCAAVGVVVVRRQPDNPLGWLFLVIGICLFLSSDGGDYAILGYRLGHHLALGPMGLALDEIWGPSLVLFAVAILLFPDGRLASPWWRGALRAYVALYALLLATTAAAFAAALTEHPLRVDRSGGLVAVDQPVNWFGAIQGPLIVALLGLSLAFVSRQALSWRRATGERRQQLKWLASGGAVSVICLALAATFGSSGHSPGSLLGAIGGIAWLGVAALPVSIGVAILKYRLYEIDRIISGRWPTPSSPACWSGCTPAWCCWPPRCSGSTARRRWPRPR
jgi:predicted permease